MLAAFISFQGFGQTCTASYSASQSGATVSFTNTSSGNYSWLYWDFGDGNTSTQMNPTHTYAPGLYAACLYIGDSMQNCYSTYCDSFFVQGGGGCTAAFTLTTSGLTIASSNSSSGASSYLWEVYDQNANLVHTTNGQNMTYTANAGGVYTVCLNAYDGNGNLCDQTCQTVTLSGGGGGSCQAYFTYTTSGNTFVFNDASTGTYDWITWDFGDGNSGTGTPVTHVYANSGLYLVCMTISDSAQTCYDTYCDSIWVQGGGGGGCTAAFTMTASGNTITTTNQSTGAGSYEWYIYDSNWNQTIIPGTNLTYTAPSAGVYTVCLYAYDNANLFCDSTCQTITLSGGGGGGCSASFQIVPDSTGGYMLITTVTGTQPFTYLWDFGDGNTSTQSNPTHVYQQTGAYTICLTMSDANGCTATYCDSLWVVGGTSISSMIIIGMDDMEIIAAGNELYPNPTTGDAWMDITAQRNVTSTVRIFSTSGQLIRTEEIELLQGNNRIAIDANGLAEGLYFLRIEAGETALRSSFIKR